MTVHRCAVRIVIEDEFDLDTEWYADGDSLADIIDAETASVENDPFAIIDSPTASWDVEIIPLQ